MQVHRVLLHREDIPDQSLEDVAEWAAAASEQKNPFAHHQYPIVEMIHLQWGNEGVNLFHKHHGMMQRCYNPENPGYQYYGAKGIKVCDLWRRDLAAFIRWCFTNGWQPGLHIDRIDTTGDYEPSNCQFLTPSEHAIKSNKERWGRCD